MKSANSDRKNPIQVGIWLDFKEANVITLQDNEVDIYTIDSGIDHGKPKGGHRSKTPYGPMDVISEGRHIERRKHQEGAYFNSIIDKIIECDEFFIMGPAEAKIGLRKQVSKHKMLHAKLQDLQTVDSITMNQKAEKVRAFFTN